MIYNMMITEYLRKSVRVEAEDSYEAYQKVADLLGSEQVVLSADDFCGRDVETMDDYENSQGNYKTHLTNSESCDVDLDFTKEEK